MKENSLLEMFITIAMFVITASLCFSFGKQVGRDIERTRWEQLMRDGKAPQIIERLSHEDAALKLSELEKNK
jgi:hypothetical protein